MEKETNYETMKAQKKSMETTCGAKKHQERNEKNRSGFILKSK